MIRGQGSWTLTLAGLMSAAVSILHLVIIFLGGPAYRYFGAGERTALQAEGGSLLPAAMTATLTVIFAVWAAYAFSGARVIRRLPHLRIGLLAIGTIYTLRGLSLVPQAAIHMSVAAAMPLRYLVFSLASLVIGLTYLLGARQAWEELDDSKPRPRPPGGRPRSHLRRGAIQGP